jgi:hypothetical protein
VAIVTMLPAVSGDIASSSEYNKLITNILDLDKRSASMTISSSRPTSPVSGQTIYETDTGIPRIWDGTSWRAMAPRVIRAASTGDLSLTTTSQAVPGGSATFTTVSPNAGVTVIATFDIEMTGYMPGYKYGRMLLDGVAMNSDRRAIWTSAGTGRVPVTQQWSGTITTAGSHTIAMQAYQDGLSTSFCRAPSILTIYLQD